MLFDRAPLQYPAMALFRKHFNQEEDGLHYVYQSVIYPLFKSFYLQLTVAVSGGALAGGIAAYFLDRNIFSWLWYGALLACMLFLVHHRKKNYYTGFSDQALLVVEFGAKDPKKKQVFVMAYPEIKKYRIRNILGVITLTIYLNSGGKYYIQMWSRVKGRGDMKEDLQGMDRFLVSRVGSIS